MQRTGMAGWILWAWSEGVGRALVVQVLVVCQSRFVFALHIIVPLDIMLAESLREAAALVRTSGTAGGHQYDSDDSASKRSGHGPLVPFDHGEVNPGGRR